MNIEAGRDQRVDFLLPAPLLHNHTREGNQMSKFTNVKQLKPFCHVVTLERGEESAEVNVWPLTAKQMESIRHAFPPPPPPMIERGGETVPNFQDAEYQRATAELNLKRTFAMAGLMIGLEALNVDNLEAASEAMAEHFLETEISAILKAGLNQRTLTPADVKGAAYAAAPFGS